jgi:hypothetical protein
MGSDWPRLSQTLRGRRQHGYCQSCDAHFPGTNGMPALNLWQECDDDDRLQKIFVWLCTPCSERLVEKHPRLYEQRGVFFPAPGVQQFCADCRFCDNMTCKHPEAQTGAVVLSGAFSRMFVDGQGRGKAGRRIGWMATHFYEPPKGCRVRAVNLEEPVEL